MFDGATELRAYTDPQFPKSVFLAGFSDVERQLQEDGAHRTPLLRDVVAKVSGMPTGRATALAVANKLGLPVSLVVASETFSEMLPVEVEHNWNYRLSEAIKPGVCYDHVWARVRERLRIEVIDRLHLAHAASKAVAKEVRARSPVYRNILTEMQRFFEERDFNNDRPELAMEIGSLLLHEARHCASVASNALEEKHEAKPIYRILGFGAAAYGYHDLDADIEAFVNDIFVDSHAVNRLWTEQGIRDYFGIPMMDLYRTRHEVAHPASTYQRNAGAALIQMATIFMEEIERQE